MLSLPVFSNPVLGYAQLLVDEMKCTPHYLASFFNTPLGRACRESLQTGSVVPRITKEALLSVPVYLPDMETQRDVVNLDQIAQTRFAITEVQEEDPERVVEALGKIAGSQGEVGTAVVVFDERAANGASYYLLSHGLKGRNLKRLTRGQIVCKWAPVRSRSSYRKAVAGGPLAARFTASATPASGKSRFILG